MSKSNGKKTKEPGIYLLPSGQYKIVATIQDAKGKMIFRRETCPLGLTLRQAVDRRDTIKQEMAQAQTQPEPLPEPPDTLGSYAVRWFAAKAPHLSPTTRRTYLEALDSKILPFIGETPVLAVNRALLMDWVDVANSLTQEDGSGYSRETRRGWWRVLKQLAQDLRADVGLLLDPTLRVKPPSVDNGHHRDRRTLSSEQLRKLLTAVRAVAPSSYVEVLVLASTGMRAGELYGLKWEDVDVERGVIHIRRSSTREGVRETTKTGHGRTVPLTPKVGEELMRHKQQLHDQDSLGYAAHDLVFPSLAGGVRSSSRLHKPLAAASALLEMEMSVTPQMIRRSFNTILLHAGVNEVVLRAMMGHASQEMTALYMGVEMEDKRAHLLRAMTWTQGEDEAGEGATLHPHFAPPSLTLHSA